MICQHISIQTPRTGAASMCANCGQPIVFDGTRWQWEFSLDPEKIRKLRTIFEIDRITGKHA